MPIIVKLDRILLERKMTLTELAERVGITLANISILKTNKARAVRFSTLAAICRELDCQPSDLLEYVPGASIESRESVESGRSAEAGGSQHEEPREEDKAAPDDPDKGWQAWG